MLVASERRRAEVEAERQQFRAEMAATDAEDLVFLDESGVTTSLTRLYGRAPRGVRVIDHVPQGHWKVLTILGAITSQGMLAAMTVEAATDSEVFRTYVSEVLVPRLRPGQIVLMDNLRAHKVAGVREAIEAAGCRVRYLPPYSPDLNPIEPAWSKLKTYLRAVKARARDVLEEAVATGLRKITAQDAHGFFAHCGYPLQ
jgi:transposase